MICVSVHVRGIDLESILTSIVPLKRWTTKGIHDNFAYAGKTVADDVHDVGDDASSAYKYVAKTKVSLGAMMREVDAAGLLLAIREGRDLSLVTPHTASIPHTPRTITTNRRASGLGTSTKTSRTPKSAIGLERRRTMLGTGSRTRLSTGSRAREIRSEKG